MSDPTPLIRRRILGGPPHCHICDRCHWNACPSLRGGTPEYAEHRWGCNDCRRPVSIIPKTHLHTCPDHPRSGVAP